MKATIELPPLTPEQLAEMFWEMDDAEQARFFGPLGACVLATPAPYSGEVGHYYPLDFQMYMASKQCTPNGLRVMELIGQQASMERLQPYIEHWQTMPKVPIKEGSRVEG